MLCGPSCGHKQSTSEDAGSNLKLDVEAVRKVATELEGIPNQWIKEVCDSATILSTAKKVLTKAEIKAAEVREGKVVSVRSKKLLELIEAKRNSLSEMPGDSPLELARELDSLQKLLETAISTESASCIKMERTRDLLRDGVKLVGVTKELLGDSEAEVFVKNFFKKYSANWGAQTQPQMVAEKVQEKASESQKSPVMEGREAGQVFENSLASLKSDVEMVRKIATEQKLLETAIATESASFIEMERTRDLLRDGVKLAGVTKEILGDSEAEVFTKNFFKKHSANGGAQTQPQMVAEKVQEKASELQKSTVMERIEAGQVFENSLATRFRWCPPGEFVMGSFASEQVAIKQWWDGSDEKQHPVKLTSGFWLAEHEVTQGEWKTVMGRSLRQEVLAMLNDEQKFNFGAGKIVTVREWIGANLGDDPAKHMGVESDDMPIYSVSWEQAAEYCQRLTERERSAGRLPAGWRYALPTEAQWEYACRAGTSSTVYNGEVEFLGKNDAPALDNIAWYAGNSCVNYTGRGWNVSRLTERQYTGDTAGPRRVGTKGANPWGLRDMIGNVAEWCADWYQAYISRSTLNPVGPASGVDRVVRGGAWGSNVARCRAASRSRLDPGNRYHFTGFRPALVSSS